MSTSNANHIPDLTSYAPDGNIITVWTLMSVSNLSYINGHAGYDMAWNIVDGLYFDVNVKRMLYSRPEWCDFPVRLRCYTRRQSTGNIYQVPVQGIFLLPSEGGWGFDTAHWRKVKGYGDT